MGQEVIVQVVKEPISTKGPRLTTELSFAGRFLVLMPFGEKVNVSSKIKSSEERARLKQLIQSIKPKNFGVIVRTVALKSILEIYHIAPDQLDGAIVSSVVPPLNRTILAAIRKITGLNAMLVGSGMKTGLNILMDNPKSVGSDMIVNAVGALAEHEPPIIIIEMGTATTMSVIDKNGRYVGGAILPGLRVSLDSMSASTAQLPRISLDTPRRVIGKNTIDCMRSGVIFGNAAMIDGMLDRIEEELGEKTSIIATGGISKIVLPLCSHTITYDGALLMKGLLHLYEKNRRTE